MTQLVLEDAVAATLASVKGEVVLCDKSGKELGRFRPTIDQATMHAQHGHLWTEEDLAQATQTLNQYLESREGFDRDSMWESIRSQGPK